LISGESTFSAVDFEQGGKPDLSAGIALFRGIKYLHAHKGIPIVGDILGAAVANDEVVKIRACWHEIVREQKGQEKNVRDVEDSLSVAAENLAQRFPQEKKLTFKLRRAGLWYYGYHDAGKSRKLFVPVWRFGFEKDGRLYHQYVNAHSNKLINSELDIANALRKEKK